MNSHQLLASNLAVGMLSGSADIQVAMQSSIRILGENPKWLRGLMTRLVRQFSHAWHAQSLDPMTQVLLHAPELRRAFSSENPPKLHSVALAPPRMAPAKIAGGSVALPDLPTVGDIANWLGIAVNELLWFSRPFSNPRESPRCEHYHHRWTPKRAGGWRLLEIPKSRLREIQRHLLRGLIDYIPLHECAHGFRARHSTLTHASLHAGKRVVIKLDLQDFFLKVTGNRVHGLFLALGYPAPAAHVLTGLCVHGVFAAALRPPNDPSRYAFELPSLDWRDAKQYADPHLPQGAPTSPALANLCAFNLDVRLNGLARAMGATYSRYADDLTFSGDMELARAAATLPSRIGAIALEEGFPLNHRKTRIMRASARQRVTGIVVNERPNLSRQEFDRLKAILHNCERSDTQAQNIFRHDDFRAHLAGRVAYAASLNPKRGEVLQRAFERVRWT